MSLEDAYDIYGTPGAGPPASSVPSGTVPTATETVTATSSTVQAISSTVQQVETPNETVGLPPLAYLLPSEDVSGSIVARDSKRIWEAAEFLG